MGIPEVTSALQALEFASEETKKIVDGILEAANARGGMTTEERDKLMQVLEIEQDLADIEVSATEEALKALVDFESEVDSALEAAVSQLEEAGK